MLQKTTFKFRGNNNQASDYGGFNFACAAEPVDGSIKIIESAHTCREGLFYNMRNRIMSNNSARQPTDKMRMIVQWYTSKVQLAALVKANTDWAMRTIPVLQAFDKIAGWPLTRVYKLDVGSRDGWLQAYYYHSSRRWMKSSYLVSLYLLLIRMCKDERITGFKDFDGLVKVIEKIQTSEKSLLIDSSYVKSSLPYWKAIMTGYPRLFRQRKIEYYWDTKRLDGSSGGAEGVQYLVGGSTQYTEVRTEMLKIKKELDAKKSK